MLRPGRSGLGFGCGREPLPSLFAKYGCKIVATDLPAATAQARKWLATNQRAADPQTMLYPTICPDPAKLANISFGELDMNHLPPELDGKFDFCWSCCALEHLGSLALGGYAAWADVDEIWFTWWLGDASGALIFTPLLVLWLRDWRGAPSRARFLEAAALWLTTMLIGLAVFGEGLTRFGLMTLPLTFLCTPPLVWAAVRFRRLEAVMLVTALCGIATWETLRGFGPFASATANEALLLLQLFMGTVSVMVISAAALLRSDPDPSEEAVRDAIAGNLCRCTGYQPIFAAVHSAAAELRGEPAPTG